MNKKLPIHVTKTYVTPRQLETIKIWCNTHFGSRWCRFTNHTGQWDIEWAGPQVNFGTSHTWFFRHAADATLFALKWL